jgi:hypothetical protein
VRRNEWLLANAPRHGELARAVKPITRLRPDLVALDPQLFARLAGPFDAKIFARASNEKPRSFSELAMEQVARDYTEALDPIERQDKEKAKNVLWSGCAVIVLLVALLSKPARDPKAPAIPTFPEIKSRMPDAPSPRYPNPVRPEQPLAFTEREVQKFKDYERNADGFPPPRYTDWLRAGRPHAWERISPSGSRGGIGKEGK